MSIRAAIGVVIEARNQALTAGLARLPATRFLAHAASNATNGVRDTFPSEQTRLKARAAVVIVQAADHSALAEGAAAEVFVQALDGSFTADIPRFATYSCRRLANPPGSVAHSVLPALQPDPATVIGAALLIISATSCDCIE
jgi:hypothetical protein